MDGYYGIGEVFVKVANLERAAEFYRDLLEFEVVERNNRQLYIYLENGHLVLKEAGSPGHDAGGPMHFAFVTSTPNGLTNSLNNSLLCPIGLADLLILMTHAVNVMLSSSSIQMETKSSLMTSIVQPTRLRDCYILRGNLKC